MYTSLSVRLAVIFWECNMNNVVSVLFFAELCVRSALELFLFFTQIFNFSLVFHFTSVFYVVCSSSFPFVREILAHTNPTTTGICHTSQVLLMEVELLQKITFIDKMKAEKINFIFSIFAQSYVCLYCFLIIIL